MLTVSELAGRSGVAPSTIRYYERMGLLTPAVRGDNGYRLFADTAVNELSFVALAKGIGLQLEEVAELRQAWAVGECRVLQAHLRSFLSEQIAHTRRQRKQLSIFEQQLETVRARLTARDPGAEPCGYGCACEADLETTNESIRDAAGIGGALAAHERAARVDEWRAALACADGFDRAPRRVSIEFPRRVDLAEQLARLCTAQTEYSSDFTFELEFAGTMLILRITGDGADALFDRLAGPSYNASEALSP